MIRSGKLEIRSSRGKGRGVFAFEDIDKDEVVELSPAIILKHDELVDTKWNTLFDYYFWMDDFVALALGFGSLYNHSETPNIRYRLSKTKRTVTFTAIRKIKKGEELLFNYKGASKSKNRLWFEGKKV